MKDWLKKMTVPLFSIKIRWGGGKIWIEKATVGGAIPVVEETKKSETLH